MPSRSQSNKYSDGKKSLSKAQLMDEIENDIYFIE